MCARAFVCVITQVIRTRSSLCDVNECSSGRDVKDLVVTKGNRDILEASSHLSTGGFPPTTDSTFVNHRAGAQYPIAALGLAEKNRGKDVSDGSDNEGEKRGVGEQER